MSVSIQINERLNSMAELFVLGIVIDLRILLSSPVFVCLFGRQIQPVTVLRIRVINFVSTGASWDN